MSIGRGRLRSLDPSADVLQVPTKRLRSPLIGGARLLSEPAATNIGCVFRQRPSRR
jgi:hypothetical protein